MFDLHLFPRLPWGIGSIRSRTLNTLHNLNLLKILNFELHVFTLLMLTNAAPAHAGPGDEAGVNPQIESIWLVDADTDSMIEQISDGEVFIRDDLPANLSVMAVANADTESVRFGYSGIISFHTENLVPYALGGDNNGDYAPFSLDDGWHQVRATPFAADNATGSYGSEVLIAFAISEREIVVDSTQDGHDSNPGDGRCSSTPNGDIDDFTTRTDTRDDGRDPNGVFTATTESVNSGDELVVVNDINRPSARQEFVVAGRCTLRAAIEESNATAGRQHVVVPGGSGPYELTLGAITITQPVDIEGTGIPTVDAGYRHGIFQVNSTDDMVLRGLRLERGDVRQGGSGAFGGALNITSSSVELLDSVVRDSVASNGGGIAVDDSQLVIRRTIVQGNRAGREDVATDYIGGINQIGGGLASVNSDLNIESTSFAENEAARGGGLMIAGAGHVDIANTAIVLNRSSSQGAGLLVYPNEGDGPDLHITWSTIARNEAGGSYGGSDRERAGGGIFASSGELIIANSILAENTATAPLNSMHYTPDCWTEINVPFTSYRANIVGVSTDACNLEDPHHPGETPHDMVGTSDDPFDAGLGSYTISGRPTILPLADSPAVDHGPNDPSTVFFGPCRDIDVRGMPRPVDDSLCDLGATEWQ